MRGPHTTLGNTLAGLGFLGIKFLHGMSVRDELLMCHHLWDHFKPKQFKSYKNLVIGFFLTRSDISS